MNNPPFPGIDRALALRLLRAMYLARGFEERVERCFAQGLIHGTVHLGIGEEGTAAGTCLALEPEDHIFVSHRGHCAALCKGVDPRRMMAELFGRETGACRGRGGSMHICDPGAGVMGANGIVGASLPIACGSALARKLKGEAGCVTAAFFGDGAFNEGAVHEAMNLASVWSLPVLFVCVDNQYGVSTHISRAMKDTNLIKRAIPYGMSAAETDGNDVIAVYETVRAAREAAIKNSEPFLIVEHTYRTSGHSKSDTNRYRPPEEIAGWLQRAPVTRLCETLLAGGMASPGELAAIEAEAAAVIDEAVRFALDSPFPEPRDIAGEVYAS